MERKWTQGPWTLHKCPCNHHSCDQFTISPQGSVGFHLSDAQLIAAAPGLYGALEEARATILELINARSSEAEGSDADWVQGIDAALAKARGENQ